MQNKLAMLMALYRSNFAAFNRFAFRERHPGQPLIDNWHITLMADRLAQCVNGEIRRLIINVPPRSLKSHTASISLPVWALGRNPRLKIMSIAGTRELAGEVSNATRGLMAAGRVRAIFPHLTPPSKSGDIQLTHGGRVISGVVGRSLIGRGADIIIVDDPLPPHAAKDEAARKAVNRWFDEEVVQRLNDKTSGTIILVMQRLHIEDLCGHLLVGTDVWEQLSLPSIATEDEIWSLATGETVSRLKGEALAPAIESREALRERLLQIGAGNFAGQYQQQPLLHQTEQEYRSGCFAKIRDDGSETMFFGSVPETDILLYEVFGEGIHHPARRPRRPTKEEFLEMARIHAEQMEENCD